MKSFLPVYMKLQPYGVLLPVNTKHVFPRFFYSFFQFIFFISFFLITLNTSAQSTGDGQQKADYKKAITERSAKIVNALSITDSVKYKKVLSVIADEYFSLGSMQDQHNAALADIKKQFPEKDKQAAAVKSQEEKKVAELMQLHNVFITHLKDNLTAEQVEKVKDGITYRILPITYTAYLDEIPALTTEQKTKIYGWLTEARELAMDAESADKKHAVFGKYKGKINNYLSAAGYDMKKEGEAWAKRIQAAKDAKQKTN